MLKSLSLSLILHFKRIKVILSNFIDEFNKNIFKPTIFSYIDNTLVFIMFSIANTTFKYNSTIKDFYPLNDYSPIYIVNMIKQLLCHLNSTSKYDNYFKHFEGTILDYNKNKNNFIQQLFFLYFPNMVHSIVICKDVLNVDETDSKLIGLLQYCFIAKRSLNFSHICILCDHIV